MAKRYDPIMCMLVDDSVKTKDAEFQMYGPEFHHPIIKASSKEEAIKKAKEIYGWGGKVEAVKVSDEKYLDKAISTCDAVDDIYIRRNNEYYVNVKLGKSNPQISATISRILNKDKRVEGVLGSPGNWDVAIEGKDNVEYIKKILSGVGNIK